MTRKNIDICLVNMPVSPIQRPSLALGTLSAILKRQGFKVKVLYANMWFAEYFGLEIHSKIAKLRPQDLLGEWLFTAAAFPDHTIDDEAFFTALEEDSDHLHKTIPDWSGFKKKILRTKAAIPGYMDWVAGEILSHKPAMVGCTSMFQQHVASLGILRKIKETSPQVVTMMGGPNCETIMGKTAHENFSWIDYMVSGEADEFIASLCHQILNKGRKIASGELPAQDLPEGVFGPTHRETKYPSSAKSYDGLPRAITACLENLPAPDYDDYFEEHKGNYLSNMILPALVFEGSRGCWWGQKSHCTFCGLNGVGMEFRDKTTEQLESELDYLSSRYGIRNFEAVDNIISITHLKNFLPKMENNKKGYSLFFETKANLKHSQIAQFRRANVRWIQPGIESLGSQVLSLMKKGVKAWQNIQTLKYARKYGLYVSWTMLCGFPGEKDEWYKDISRLPPLLAHLQPGGLTVLRYDRYSVYHRDPEQYGIDLVPSSCYEHIYPLSKEALNDLAYFFEDRTNPGFSRKLLSYDLENRPWLIQALDSWRYWRRDWSNDIVLSGKKDGDKLVITDTRPIALSKTIILDPVQAEILTFCDGAPTRAAIIEAFKHLEPCVLDETLALFDRRHLVLEIDARILCLVLDEPLEDVPDQSFSPFGRLLQNPPPREPARNCVKVS